MDARTLSSSHSATSYAACASLSFSMAERGRVFGIADARGMHGFWRYQFGRQHRHDLVQRPPRGVRHVSAVAAELARVRRVRHVERLPAVVRNAVDPERVNIQRVARLDFVGVRVSVSIQGVAAFVCCRPREIDVQPHARVVRVVPILAPVVVDAHPCLDDAPHAATGHPVELRPYDAVARRGRVDLLKRDLASHDRSLSWWCPGRSVLGCVLRSVRASR